MYLNITTSATKNIDDDVNISIEEGIGDDSTFEETTLRLLDIETTFEKVFACATFTIAFFGVVGNLATICKIIRDPKFHILYSDIRRDRAVSFCRYLIAVYPL